jgi:tetratricopeptide (TPR) repeat protein
MLQFLENSEKKIFYILAGILLIALPLLSLKSGISGDEDTYHYPHGKNVFKYYSTLGKDTSCLHYDNSVLQMYGPVFDLATVAVIKLIKPEDEYMVRHIMNSMTGWAAIFFAGLIAVMLGGWRAGIITLLFMFLSPRFLGHSFNNPKDIPFAAAYIFTIYAIIRFLKYYPEKRIRYAWPVALGIGLTIGVRVGGILLAIYFLFFTGLYYMFKYTIREWFRKDHLFFYLRLLGYALLISVIGYLIGILLWPYAHQAPIRRTLEAMKYMEQYATSLRQVFEGKIIWSDNVPKHYLPKYILITIPEYIIIGFISFFVLFRKWIRENISWYIVLLFVSIFPVAYIIYKGSNIYGGWRHVLFVYPPLVVLASLGISNLIDRFPNRYYRWGITAIVVFLMALPFRHIVANHPHEYIYYNALAGGVKKAYGNYEMDYFYHTLRAGSEWLIKNKIKESKLAPGEQIKVVSNLRVGYYFRNDTDKVKIGYIRYYDRGNKDWDYAILANSYINPYQLKHKIWPPANTIHTIDVDGKPVCAILERTDRNDLKGFELMQENKPQEAIAYFQEALKKDPKYELMYLNLSQAYLNTGEFDRAVQAASECLKLYPDFDRALNFLGMAYLNKQEFENAFQVFQRNMKVNPKNVASYYYAGLIYAQTNDFDTALKYLQESIKVNGRYKPSYYLMANIYEQKGMHEQAEQCINYANTLQ